MCAEAAMGYVYVVKPGDCLWYIAKREGFSHWRTIYDHPLNADYRAKRPNPNVIYPGDRLYIPDLNPKHADCATESRHRFRKYEDTAHLYLVIEDDEGTRVEGEYTLTIDGTSTSGTLENGEVRTRIASDAESGKLVVHGTGSSEDYQRSWTIMLGHLDPVEELSGVQARLRNLGIDCGPVDNEPGPLTKAGVIAFQKLAFADEKEWDGIPGPKTQAKLRDFHRA
jgi:N-acetylmuramoyl-L-alanine amidase